VPVVQAVAAPSATEPLVPVTITRRGPGPRDVVIDLEFCGVCHSDIHTVRGDWGPVPYPLVVGHEMAGLVAAVGSDVTAFAVGDRVGVGTMVDSCRECESCRAGFEQYCLAGNVQAYNSIDRDGTVTQGGYSGSVVVDEHFVLRIPDAIPLEAAGPLLCAGITTWSPLRHWEAGPGRRVAVLGLGGLGHLAVKLAVALGADVTVLSRSLRKREDALRLGAGDVRATSDPQTFTDLANTFDLVVNTVSAPVDVDAFLRLLRTNGTFVNVGAPAEPLPVHMLSLIIGRRSFAGSATGGIAETQEMLDFCAAHGVLPDIELVAPEGINEAYERVLASDVRYRFVLDVRSLRQTGS
jgi:uncharacterized zinc-type alcohol dehydrogenase-like protein